MNTQVHRLEFAPPPAPKRLSAWALAVLAHLLLLAALTWGVQWNKDSVSVDVEAELWSAVPQAAAPKWIEPTPELTPEPTPVPPQPEPKPEPPPKPRAEPEPVVPPKVDIALEKEKLRQKEREKERDKKEQLEREKLEREKKEKQERQERQERDKREADKKRAEEQKRQDELKKKERKEAEVVAKLREENLKRMTGQAGVEGATGAAGATGTALQASGPSPSYAGRIRARIKPNIVLSEEISGNPVAEVEVRAAPDGTIVGRKLIKSSGVANWDEAVLKAIDKTEILPRDTDGRVPSPLVISFRPKD